MQNETAVFAKNLLSDMACFENMTAKSKDGLHSTFDKCLVNV